MIARDDFYYTGDLYEEAALSLLASWPGMLDKAAPAVNRAEPLLGPNEPTASMDWAGVSELAAHSPYTSGERAFLALAADLAGASVRDGLTLRSRFDRLGRFSQHDVMAALWRCAEGKARTRTLEEQIADAVYRIVPRHLGSAALHETSAEDWATAAEAVAWAVASGERGSDV